MRVITGIARGMNLRTLEGLEVRPTTQRTKEGMFSSIQFALLGADVLDLFAGSGQLGIEALSRGARHAVFVDQSPKSIAIVRENLAKTKLDPLAEVCQREACRFLLGCTDESFDFIFLDPPYRQGILEEILPQAAKKLRQNGKILCEHERDLQLNPENFGLLLQKRYTYGKIVVSVLVHARNEVSDE